MILIPGHCIKCGCSFMKGSAFNHLYQHLKYKMSDGTGIAVGICSNCEIDESEWPKVMDLYNEYMKIHNPKWKDDNRHIVEFVERENAAEVRLKAQGGRCIGCHELIKGEYIITSGYIMHENCNLPAPKDHLELKHELENRSKNLREEVKRLENV